MTFNFSGALVQLQKPFLAVSSAPKDGRAVALLRPLLTLFLFLLIISQRMTGSELREEVWTPVSPSSLQPVTPVSEEKVSFLSFCLPTQSLLLLWNQESHSLSDFLRDLCFLMLILFLLTTLLIYKPLLNKK